MAFNRETFTHFWQHIEALLGKKVDKVNGKSLVADSEISRLASVKTGLEVSDTEEELEEGVYLTNADQLGGLNASEYVTKEDLTTMGGVGGGAVSSVNGKTGDVTITAASLGALTSAPVTSVGGKTGAVTLSAGTGISVSGTTISNSGVTSVNGSTGAITIPAIKYVDLTFTFSGESLGQYATAPSDLTSSGQIINVISNTNTVIITAAQISGSKIWVYGRTGTVTGEGSTLYPYTLDYKTESFSARVFYF